jgi:hypothetical protein
VEELRVNEGDIKELLQKLTNFSISYYEPDFFGDPMERSVLKIQLKNFRFQDNYTNIFSNLFSILSKLPLTESQFEPCKKPLFDFLRIETELSWFDLKEFDLFVMKKTHLFSVAELEKLLFLAVKKDRFGFNKYQRSITGMSKSILKQFPDYRLKNEKIVSTALLNATSEDGHHENFNHLLNLANICDEERKRQLYSGFEKYLDGNFSGEFYERLLLTTDFDVKRKDYFLHYCNFVNNHRGGEAHKFGTLNLTDLYFYNLVNLLYRRNICLNDIELAVFKGLNLFEAWLLRPFDFDYALFEAKWLKDLADTIIVERLANYSPIAKALELALEEEFNPILAEIKYQYFGRVYV